MGLIPTAAWVICATNLTLLFHVVLLADGQTDAVT